MTGETALRIEISTLPGEVYHAGNLPLAITFTNSGAQPLRILRQFEPLPVFFSFEMVDMDETPRLMPGGGKVDLRRDRMEYITLNPEEVYKLQVDIHGLLPSPFTPGIYMLNVVYHNQYGEDCFRGRVSSNVITIDFEDAEQ